LPALWLPNQRYAGSAGAGPVGLSEFFKPGDSITIDVISPEFATWTSTIRDDGLLMLPLGRRVIATGKTRPELEEAIKDAYNGPERWRKVKVRVAEFYFVTGEVKNPGRYKYNGFITALEAIEKAGHSELDQMNAVILIRANGTKLRINRRRAAADFKLNPVVYPGDRIHVVRVCWGR
jgi:protein involved in polysaccharide export with SLBB domain